MKQPGLIQVYTGNGKGKTTASLGLALRAVGHGFRVLMIQFMKDNEKYGETKSVTCLPGLEVVKAGRDVFVDLKNPDPIDKKLARDGWERARAAILSREYQVVILDELNVAMATGLLPIEEVAAFLRDNQRQQVEIVLTGRYAPQAILDMADLITEMQEIRHPFQAGVPARQGIDF